MTLSCLVRSLFYAVVATPVAFAAIGPEELVAPQVEMSGGSLRFTVKGSIASRTYQLQASDMMAAGTWANVEPALAGNSSDIVFNTPYLPAQSRRFFRFKINEVPLPREGFVLIPAGPFLMGNQSDAPIGEVLEDPVHEVHVSGFFMARHEVTKALWDEVRAWAADHGYVDLPPGSTFGGTSYSKGADHPVHLVMWMDLIKWCNARSEMDQLTPCYTFNGQVIRSGSPQPVCNWNADGYRLPTEAEWEKAARGGQQGKNFPWGNGISHANANYYSSVFSYETVQDQGYHPSFATGGYPYTAPVGSFAPNGYGLYDMVGNVGEWCWDGFSSYQTTTAPDPRGPSAWTDYRVLRGSSWDNYASYGRVSARDFYYFGYADDYNGFRPVYKMTN